MTSFKVIPWKTRHLPFACFTSGVLQTAMKESQIEQNLNDIQQQWQTMRFAIHKHFRHGNVAQERGFLLSDVDGIVQALEDSTLLLNGILHSIVVSRRRIVDLLFSRNYHVEIRWHLPPASRTMDSNIVLNLRSD